MKDRLKTGMWAGGWRGWNWAWGTLFLASVLVSCGGEISRLVVGDISVVAVVRPDEVRPGPVTMHLQLSTADGRWPLDEVALEAWVGERNLRVQGVATPGAYDVFLEMGPEEELEVDLRVFRQNQLFEVRAILETGVAGARLVAG